MKKRLLRYLSIESYPESQEKYGFMEPPMRLSTPLETPKIVKLISVFYLDILLTLLVSSGLYLVIQFEPRLTFLAAPRLLLGLAYVFFLPGYWLSVAFFPEAGDLELTQRIAISLGLSVAWAPILALMLDNLEGGLNLWPIFFGEYCSISAFVILALLRQSGAATARPFIPRFSWRLNSLWGPLSRSQKYTYAAALGAFFVGVFLVARVFLIPSPAELMTEFYVIQEHGLAENYPREAQVGDQLQVTLGITNREQTDHTYQVEVWVEDLWAEGEIQRVAKSDAFEVPRGESHEWPLSWQMPWEGTDQKVLFILFIDDAPDPYRRLQLFLNVIPK